MTDAIRLRPISPVEWSHLEASWPAMAIADITTPALVHLDVAWTTKHEVIDRLIAALAQDGAVTDAAAFKEAVSEREVHGPTGMQDGLT